MKPTAANRVTKRPRPRSSAVAAPLAVDALQLLGRWTRLSPARVGSALSCSCCIAAPGVKLGDIEHDILGFLYEKHAGAGTPGVVPLLQREAGFKRGGGGSVVSLLRALARSEEMNSYTSAAQTLLADLTRCIESLEEQQRGIE